MSHTHDAPPSLEQRKNSLTEGDADLIRSIVESIHYTQISNTPQHMMDCRFGEVTREEFMEIIKSHRKFNSMMDDSKKTVRTVLIGMFLVFIVGIMSEGMFTKFIARIKSVF